MEARLKFILILWVVFSVAVCRIHSLEIELDEGYSQTLSCDVGQALKIDAGKWTDKFSFLKLITWINLPYCTFDTTQYIQDLCQGKNNCVVTADQRTLGQCPYNMYLKIWYWCEDCIQNRKRRTAGDMVYIVGEGWFRSGGICDTTARLSATSNTPTCPNNRFMDKHMCHNCEDTELSASLFASQVQNIRLHGSTAPSNINTVFVYQHMSFHWNGPNCVFDFHAAKYQCFKNINNIWSCTRYPMVIATHDAGSGHYFPQMDV